MPATTISRSRRPRTGVTTTIVDHLDGYPRSFHSYGRYTVTCEAHGSTANASAYGRALELARQSDRFCSSCTVVQPGNRASRRSAAPRPARLGLARRYGVEFEFFGISRRVVQDWLATSGMERNGWRVKSDCSVSGEGLELISPPLSGENGLDQIRTALAWLNANDARVNRTCGTHVHHDASDLNIDAIKRFVRTYVANQGLINWLVSPSRRTVDNHAQYCQPWTESELAAMDANSSERYVWSPTRYKTVNVQSYGRHGTLEIRQHQGTLSYDKIVAWIKLGQAMMDAANERAQAIPAQTGIKTLLDRTGLDEDAAAYLLGRAIQFGAPVQTVAA